MYELSVRTDFSSAHSLRNYKGRCENLHGHNWQVEAVICGDTLNATELLYDFKDLKNDLESIIDPLDHQHLNDLEFFKTHNPSSENIAKYIFDKLAATIKADNVTVKCVSIWESARSKATYYRR